MHIVIFLVSTLGDVAPFGNACMYDMSDILHSVHGISNNATGIDFPVRVAGISTDTRTIQRGEMFIAIKGANFDGNNFVDVAFNSGASVVLIDSVSKATELQKLRRPYILVDNTISALQRMAQYCVANYMSRTIKIVVTGSIGKTTTKEIIAKLLGAVCGQVSSSIGNMNNKIGFPLSIIRTPVHPEFYVAEIGASNSGEVSCLSKLVNWNIAIITCIGYAHIEHFGSRHEIAVAKAEVFDGLLPYVGGVILNHDDEFYQMHCDMIGKRFKILSFGRHVDSDVCLLNCTVCDNILKLSISVSGTIRDVTMPFRGMQLVNALMISIAVFKMLNFDESMVLAHVDKLDTVAGRGLISEINYHGKNITLIDESYNAGYDSMRNAICSLGIIGNGRRKVAILGDMLELGSYAEFFHKKLLSPLEEYRVSIVHTVGNSMLFLRSVMPREMCGVHFDSVDELIANIDSLLLDDDTLMVKSSAAMYTSKLVKTLLKESTLTNAS